MSIQAAIYGCAGLQLTEDERRFFRTHNPFGLILFARNIDHPAQVQALIADFKTSVSHDNPLVLVDQEGGRVARLRPPYWPEYPAAQSIGVAYRKDQEIGIQLARAVGRLIAADLFALGFNVACAPVLDLRFPEGHDVIGTRAYGADVNIVAVLGRAMAAGLSAGGVLPVIKHIPGHGRAAVDTHFELPTVETAEAELTATDFETFKRLNDLPLAMTGHVVFAAIDPDAPATTSNAVIQSVIRGAIGFDGLLMTDDLSMQALAGSMTERVTASLAAGCDVILHCNGDMVEMTEIAAACGALDEDALSRASRAIDSLSPPDDEDMQALRALVSTYVKEGA